MLKLVSVTKISSYFAKGMLVQMASLAPKTSPLYFTFSKNTSQLFVISRNFKSLSHKRRLMVPVICNAKTNSKNPISMTKKATHFSTTSPEALPEKPLSELSTRKSRKRARIETPEMILTNKLGQCSKNGDLTEALHLYKEARAENVKLSVHHYNVLLYLCSAKSEDMELEEKVRARLVKGFEIFNLMVIDNVEPNEATFTNASRLAAARKDPALAFNILKQMKDRGIVPRLRSYGPALFGFCEKGMADEAYEVDSHMVGNGVLAEEAELAALIRVSSENQREGKVYEMMHRLRGTVRQVSEDTASITEEWFRSTKAGAVGEVKWDSEKVKRGIVEGGGGWHGQGWLGRGEWRVLRTRMDGNGICQACGEKLVSIDIDPNETENFAKSLAKLACEKEIRNNFVKFQEWLQRHGPFDAVVDGANLGLANQHIFSFPQITRVVNQLRQISPSNKLPLVVLHQARVHGGSAQHPNNKKLLESWKKTGALYATPQGSNDDWYWLYAAVSSKCLLVTNDEMRDHLFNLLGDSFFPRWKEKHQVRLKPDDDGLLSLHMPPPYSIVVQESEKGSWHIPTVIRDDLEAPRQWICATRTENA